MSATWSRRCSAYRLSFRARSQARELLYTRATNYTRRFELIYFTRFQNRSLVFYRRAQERREGEMHSERSLLREGQRAIFNTSTTKPLASPGLFSRPRFRPRSAYPPRKDPVVCTRDNGRAHRRHSMPFSNPPPGSDLERHCRKLARGLLSRVAPGEKLYPRGFGGPILARYALKAM